MLFEKRYLQRKSVAWKGRVIIRSKLVILLAVFCGAGGALLRAMELSWVIDPETSLIPAWHPVSIGLIALSAAFVGGVAWLTGRHEKSRGKKTPVSVGWLAAELAAALMLAASGVLAASYGPPATAVSRLVFGALGIASALCLGWIAFSMYRGKLSASSGYGFLATVPVFWSCFGLILDFWSHAGNATRTTYMYGMFALIFLTLSLYGSAGFFFRSSKKRRVALYALSGVYFAIMTAGGALTARYVLSPSPSALADAAKLSAEVLMRLGFAALHLLCVYQAVEAGRFSFPAEDKAPSSGSGALSPDDAAVEKADRILSGSMDIIEEEFLAADDSPLDENGT